MTRSEALEIAKANFVALNSALMKEWSGTGPKVDEAAYGYQRGWFNIGGHNIPACEFAPNNQPYLD